MVRAYLVVGVCPATKVDTNRQGPWQTTRGEGSADMMRWMASLTSGRWQADRLGTSTVQYSAGPGRLVTRFARQVDQGIRTCCSRSEAALARGPYDSVC